MPSGQSSRSANATASIVLSIECLKGGSNADEWSASMPETGDIVEEIRIGDLIVKPNFEKGEAGVQKTLRDSFKKNESSIEFRVRRGLNEFVDIKGFRIFHGEKKYILRADRNPNSAVKLVDRKESECLRLQALRASRMLDTVNKPIQDGYYSYPLERRTHMLSYPDSTRLYSILFLPRSSNSVASRYNDIEDTLARAEAWLNASRATGAPVSCSRVQTESLLIKSSGESTVPTVNVDSLSNLSNVANASLYGFEDLYGVDIGVVRAIRLWFSPVEEVTIEIQIRETDTMLGFSMARTQEGFIYISSVAEGNDDDTPSVRSGINNLYKEASRASRLLIVSRVSNQKVLPWMVSWEGAIRCFDTISLKQKLCLHRVARVTIRMHVFLWDRSSNSTDVESISHTYVQPGSRPPNAHLAHPRNENQEPLSIRLEGDYIDPNADEFDSWHIIFENDGEDHFSFSLSA